MSEEKKEEEVIEEHSKAMMDKMEKVDDDAKKMDDAKVESAIKEDLKGLREFLQHVFDDKKHGVLTGDALEKAKLASKQRDITEEVSELLKAFDKIEVIIESLCDELKKNKKIDDNIITDVDFTSDLSLFKEAINRQHENLNRVHKLCDKLKQCSVIGDDDDDCNIIFMKNYMFSRKVTLFKNEKKYRDFCGDDSVE